MSSEALPARVRVSKRFFFELAHALSGHDGTCAGVHGHSYVLDVTLIGFPRAGTGHPKDGMVMDLADLKRIVQEAVIDRYDHTLLLHECEMGRIELDGTIFARTVFTPWQPTCENILLDIVARMQPLLAEEARLSAVLLKETATSWAEWEDRE